MKKNLLTIAMVCLYVFAYPQVTLYEENFETVSSGVNYFTSIPEFTDGDADFFKRTDGSDLPSNYQLSNFSGNYFFAANDIDGEGALLPVNFTTKVINITGLTNLDFSILIAEDDDGTIQDWDNSDYVHILYSIDGGVFQNLIWIEGDESSGTSSNSIPRIDTNFDGIGDGIEITSTFTQFTRNIIVSNNSTIQFKIEFFLNAGDEDIAFDDILLIDNSPTASVVRNEIENFSLYPNPVTSNHIVISSASGLPKNIEIYNVNGQKVFTKSIIDNENLNISSLPKGIFFVKVEEKGKIATRKIIIN